MCTKPTLLNSGQLTRCRECWQCTKERVDDYVGRCIAESETAVLTLAATLTYAGDGLNTVVLTYPDVKNFIKRMRKKYKFRYIVAGEYGSEKGRAHWHMIFFFYGDVLPEIYDGEQQHDEQIVLERFKDDPRARNPWKQWGLGFVYWQKPDYGSFYYVLKYAMKNQFEDVSIRRFNFSKVPALGVPFFQNYAARMVEEGIPLEASSYKMRGFFGGERKTKTFRLQGATLAEFVVAYVKAYRLKHGEDPNSEFLDRITHRVDFPSKFHEFVVDYVMPHKEKQVRRVSFDDIAKPYPKTLVVKEVHGYTFWLRDDGLHMRKEKTLWENLGADQLRSILDQDEDLRGQHNVKLWIRTAARDLVREHRRLSFNNLSSVSRYEEALRKFQRELAAKKRRFRPVRASNILTPQRLSA